MFSMYRRMRQERKKREDDDAHSVISEARSQRSMVIDGGSVSSRNFIRYSEFIELVVFNLISAGTSSRKPWTR